MSTIKNESMGRRSFLAGVPMMAGAAALTASRAGAEEVPATGLSLASNQYSWVVFYQRENRDFNASLETGLKDVTASGLNGFEPSFTSPDQVQPLVAQLKKLGLEMRSLYVNSTLHIPEDAEKSIHNILAIAQIAREAGTRFLVTNPNPIQWGRTESKNDDSLKFQAEALDSLGEKLKQLDITLAYHNHNVELLESAREFHHMMVGTNPANVSLCLDVHWVWRGTGNSSVALFDILQLYGARVRELHLRQSRDGIWSETFEEGDIDYHRVADALRRIEVKPHLVLEIAVEKGTPKTLDPVTAHRRSCEYARKIFAEF